MTSCDFIDDITFYRCVSLQELLEQYFSSEATPPEATFDLLTTALSIYIRLHMHKRAEFDSQQQFTEMMEELLAWCDRVIVPHLNASPR